MSVTNTFGVDIIARKDKTDKTQAFLFARITVNEEETEISLKEKVPHAQWDSKHECVTGRPVQVKAINDHIDNVRYKIKETYRQLMDKGEYFDVQDVKGKYLGIHHSERNKEHTLLKLIKKHEVECGPHLAAGTMKNYIATEAYAKNFIKWKFKTDDVHVARLDFTFITEFENYIPLYPLKQKDPCTGNGTAKHIERIKKMVSWGKLLGWLKADPFEGFSAHRKRTKKKKLKLHELVEIENKEFANSNIAYARDLFVFSCYTGLAFADVMALKPEHFTLSQNGKIWCHIHRAKSHELSAIPVLQRAAVMIGKYKDDSKSIVCGRIFPQITNQEVNRLLKVIQEVCGVDVLLTFHLARHAFATIVALKNGVPIKTAQKMMGIIKMSTIEIYAEVDEELMEEQMAEAEVKLEARKKFRKPMEVLSK